MMAAIYLLWLFLSSCLADYNMCETDTCNEGWCLACVIDNIDLSMLESSV